MNTHTNARGGGTHRDERVVAGPNPTLFYYACNQGEITFLQIAGGEEGLTTLALPHLLILANVCCVKASRRLSRADIPVSHPKGTSLRRAVIYKFHPQCVHLQQRTSILCRGVQTDESMRPS